MNVELAERLAELRKYDTPTICNALELIDRARRGIGYTMSNMHCTNSNSGPIAGIALTATIRSAYPSALSDDQLKQQRLKYYEYMHTDVSAPKVCVMQDVDGRQTGRGPFWGEFNTRVHRALGFHAIVTDGSVRDVTKLPTDVLILSSGLRPSHAYVHIVSFGGQVNVFGMVVSHGDVVHADEHGAVSFSTTYLGDVASSAREFMDSEAPIIDACKTSRLTIEELTRLYLARTQRGTAANR